MREILLNGVQHILAPDTDIIQRAINPWKAQVRQTGGREYSDFGQAELEEYFDFRNGIGKNRGIGSDARLEFSEGVDFSVEGQAVLGPLVTSTTINALSTLTIANDDFETDVSPASGFGWVEDSGNWSRSTTQSQGGTYSWRNQGVVTGEYIYQDISGYIAGATYTFTVYRYCGIAATTVKVGIDDGVSTTYGSASGSVAWVQISVEKTISASATQLRLIIEIADGTAGGDVYIDTADLVTTAAGTFTPVNFIDFQANTYCYGDKGVLKWSGSDWDYVAIFADAVDALVITDSTDEYFLIVSLLSGIYTIDGSAWLVYHSEYTPDGTTDEDSAWTNAANAIDDDTGTYATVSGADKYLQFDFNTPITTDECRIWASDGASGDANVNCDFYYDGAWNDVFDGTVAGGEWVNLTNSAGVKEVEKIRVESSDGNTFRIWEFDVEAHFHGHMAPFENRVYSIHDVSGAANIYFTAAKDIDERAGGFVLTGNYGTIFDLFEGKLLSDGSNTLYFCGTEGLYSLDTTNQLAYKQEVAYPPITNAGNVGLYWNANVWVATGYGILKIAPATATFVGPDQDDGLPATFQGKIYDFATVNNWLVFCVNGGTTDNSSILKRNSSLGGNLQVYSSAKQHKEADTSNVVTSSDATDQGTLNTLLNEIYGDYNNHIASTTYHIFADTTNVVTSSAASSEATAVTLANEIKGDYNAHIIFSTRHGGALGLPAAIDTDNTVTTADCSDLATAIALANEIKADYNTHIALLHKAITCIHHSPSSLYTNGRLWFGESKGIKYMMMPDTTSNVKQVSSYTYVDDSGYAKLPIFRNLAMISKTALGITAVTKSCDSNDYVHFFYGLNGAAPTTALGTFQSSPLPPRLEFNSGLGTEFYTIQFAFKLIRGSTNTNSPELESLIFHYLATPNTISGFQLHIQATLDDAEEKIAAFETIRDTNTLVLFYPSGDANKTAYKVKLTTMPLRFYHENMQEREGYIQVDLQEIFNG